MSGQRTLQQQMETSGAKCLQFDNQEDTNDLRVIHMLHAVPDDSHPMSKTVLWIADNSCINFTDSLFPKKQK